MIEERQRDGEDRGEIRQVFAVKNSDIKNNGITMCKKHTWRKLSDMEVACTVCPTAWIVKPEAVENLVSA